jgi:hypothetical protein
MGENQTASAARSEFVAVLAVVARYRALGDEWSAELRAGDNCASFCGLMVMMISL